MGNSQFGFLKYYLFALFQLDIIWLLMSYKLVGLNFSFYLFSLTF